MEVEKMGVYLENKIKVINKIYCEIPQEMKETKLFLLGYLIALEEIKNKQLN